MKFKKTTLPNGVRVIAVPVRDNPSTTVMVACEAGSNYESKKENGLAHFLEHMLFKGTPSRPSASSVSTELDTIGAESNAFTGNEMVAYHAKAEKRHWKKLLEIVSDMYLNPSFPAADLEKERGVILQEIAMYHDLPKSHVWDVLAKLLYGDTPAGRPIIGPAENIKRFTREDFLAYHRKHYEPKKTLVVVAGDIDPKSILAEARKIFKSSPKAKKAIKEKVVEKQSAPGMLLEKKKSDQTHLIVALRGYDAQDKRAAAAMVAMGILGAGMSSRLFHRLRTEMGACYYIYASHDSSTDHGVAYIPTGIDPKRLKEVVQAILDECKRLTYEKVSDKELQKVKDYLSSHLYMGLETSDALAGHYLSDEIIHNKLREPEEIEAEIRNVSAEDVMKIAQDLFVDKKLNLALVGNVSNPAPVKKILTFK